MEYNIIIGATGLIILLVAFVIEHLKKKNGRLYFNLLNLIGSTILAVYAIMTWNIIFIILEFTWALFSLMYLIRKK